MNFDPSRFLTQQILSLKSAILLLVLILYAGVTFAIFFNAVVPSLDRGTTSVDFSVDSTVYIDMADSLREGRADPWVIGSLATFPNTLWTPVFISLVLNSALLVMLTNYAMFIFATTLLKRSFPISLGTLVVLLLLNPTTTTSILCVNKEILDLVAIAIFLYSRRKRSRLLLVVALVLALLNRYEICLVMLVFLLAQSRLNPLRRWRWVTLSLLVCSLNFITPVLGAEMLARRFEEAESAGIIKTLDLWQLHYLYILAVIPKIADNLLGFLPSPWVWRTPSSWLYINFFNNAACAVLILVNVIKRRLTLQNDLIYFAAIGAVIVAQSMSVQPRYFYFTYVLLCLQASHRKSWSSLALSSPKQGREFAHA